MEMHESSSFVLVDAELFFRARVSFKIIYVPENATIFVETPDAS